MNRPLVFRKTHGLLGALAGVPTVISGGCSMGKHLAGSGRLMRNRLLAGMLLLLLLPLLLPLPLCYLGSLCVSPDDVNLSSARPQRRSLEAAAASTRQPVCRWKIFKGNIHPNNRCNVEHVLYIDLKVGRRRKIGYKYCSHKHKTPTPGAPVNEECLSPHDTPPHTSSLAYAIQDWKC